MNILNQIRIKIIETIGKYQSIIKNKNIISDRLFIENHENWERVYKSRESRDLSEVNIKRIIKAYELAMKNKFDKDLYYISDEWISIYKKNMSLLISTLNKNDHKKLNQLLSNFFRQKFSNGLVGLPTKMNNFFKKTSSIDKKWFLIDSVYRYRLLKQSFSNFDIEDLKSGEVGNPYGIYDGENFIRSNSDYQLFFSKKISQITNKENLVVLEVGGGFGGTAEFLKKQNKNLKTYINVDLPETLVISTYYLMAMFPDSKFLLYGESPNNNEVDFILYPSFMIDKTEIFKPDIAVNTYSFSEMSYKAAQNYIDIFKKMKVPKIFHVNHTFNSKTKAGNFNFDPYIKIYGEKSMWNYGRSSTADEVEFLFSYPESSK